MNPPQIFISYCHEDKPYKDELCNYLRTLEIDGQITVWVDEHIKTGQGWKEAIQAAIKNADIAILLVTTNFLNSEFISKVEVPLMLQRRGQEELEMFPILADDCLWDEIPWLRSIHLWSEGDAPVWCLEDVKRKKALLKIAKAVASLTRGVRELPVPIDPSLQSEVTSKSLQPTPVSQKPIELVQKQDISKGSTTPSTYSASSRKRRRWYALVLLVTLSCFWFFCASITFKKTDPAWLPLSPLKIKLPQYKFISPNEQEKLSFVIHNPDSNDHKTQLLLQWDKETQCSSEGNNTIFEDNLPSKKSKEGNVQIVLCGWNIRYLGKPQVAGLGLLGNIDDSSVNAPSLPLYIAPLPNVRLLNSYMGFATLMGAVFFLFLWLLEESNLNLRRRVGYLV